MTTDVIALPKDAKLIEAVEKLSDNNISSIVITDKQTPLGIITERDIARIAATTGSADEMNSLPVSNFMSKNPVTVYKNADVVTALEIMERNRIRRLVVTDRSGKLKGIITYSDILRKLEEEFFKVHTTIDAVTTTGIVKVSADTQFGSAIQRMSGEKKSCILVTSSDSSAADVTVGILTERDIVKLLLRKIPMDTPVKDVCTKNIVYASHDTILYDAIRIMHERRIRHLVVVDNKMQLKGIVTQTGIIGLLHENITKGIRDQLQRFKESLDMLQTGFIEFELNNEGTILWINKYGAKELGFENVDSAIGSSFARLLKDKGQWSDFVSKANGKPAAVPFIFYLNISGGKVIDGSFRIRKFAAGGIFKDITERFNESECIRNERNRFENILKTMSEGLIIYDNKGIIKDINDAALSMIGLSRDEVIGQPYYSHKFTVIDKEGNLLNRNEMIISEVLRTGLSVKNMIRGLKRANGNIVWFTASVTPILGQDNVVEEIIHVLTDITELYNLEKRTQKILETAKEGYWEVSLDGKILKINKALSKLLGYREDELIGKSIYDLVDEDNKRVFEQALERRREGVSESYEITLKHKNGFDVYAIVSASPLMESSDRIHGAFAFITDVTDLKLTHNMLHTIASFYKDLSRALTETETYAIFKHYLLSLKKGESKINAVYLTNIDSSKHYVEEVISHNDSGLQELGKFPGLDKCKAYIYAATFVVNDMSKDYACPFQRFGAGSGSYCCTAINIGGSVAGILHLYSRHSNFFTDDIKEAIDSFIALFAPVVNNMRLMETNKKLALIDPLTGLYNRRYLEAFMEKQLAIADRNNQLLSMIMLDIDNFKYFNDTNGHDAGDMALRSIAHAIGKNIRVSDIGVRYGGEEFIIVLPNTDKATAFEVAERIRTTIETTPVAMGRDKRMFVTASLGVATYGIDANSFDILLSKADNALYDAKKAGKNRICLA
jgi:diguanylate cyclase (GGDEF)-like protein/PAS domain S-box-containing protein